jgi:hypothetical protein
MIANTRRRSRAHGQRRGTGAAACASAGAGRGTIADLQRAELRETIGLDYLSTI